jgi:hypothetical protein
MTHGRRRENYLNRSEVTLTGDNFYVAYCKMFIIN